MAENGDSNRRNRRSRNSSSSSSSSSSDVDEFTRSQVLPFMQKQSEMVNALFQNVVGQQQMLVALFQGNKLPYFKQ